MRLVLLAAIALVACDSTAPPVAPAERAPATYLVTFEASWSLATHPDAFPPNPHFSRLTGAAHAETTTLWSLGEPATDGIRSMAETGATATLQAEVEALGDAASYVEGGPIRTSPGAATVELTVTDDRPLATVVTMLAPSPDWFVGTDGIDLREGDGWAARVEVPLTAYDAGTDDGASYTAADVPRSARAPVAVSGYAPLEGTTVGTMTFVRQ